MRSAMARRLLPDFNLQHLLNSKFDHFSEESCDHGAMGFSIQMLVIGCPLSVLCKKPSVRLLQKLHHYGE